MLDWIKAHPYLTGGLVLAVIVLFLVFRGRRGGSDGGVVVQQGGGVNQRDAIAADLQARGIQASVDVQSQQTAAALAAKMAEVDSANYAIEAQRAVALQQIVSGAEAKNYETAATLSAIQSQTMASMDIAATQAGAAVQMADIQTRGAVDIAGINAGAAVSIAGIQGDVAKYGYDAQFKALQDTNRTAVDLANIGLLGLQDTNATGLAVVREQETTRRFGIETAGNVASLDILANWDVASQQIGAAERLQTQNQTSYWASVMANDRWGSGQNQVAALAAITGNTPIGVAASVGEGNARVARSSMFSNIFGSLFGAVGAAAQPGGAITQAVA